MLSKKILIIVCLFMAVKASAQTDIVVRGDTIILANGAKFWLGEQVTLTTGSNPDKTFNFIYAPEVLRLIKKKPLAADYAGRHATIKKFQRDGAYKDKYSYNILVLDFGDPRRFWCDVQGALDNSEIVNTSPGAKSNAKDAKLAHLKKLLDSGEITQEEYETLKNKIVNNKDSDTATKKDNTKKDNTKKDNNKKDSNKPVVY
jgi:hypothetical protein